MRQITKSFIVALLAMVALGNTAKAQNLIPFLSSQPAIESQDTVYRGSPYLIGGGVISFDSSGAAFPANEPFSYEFLVDSNIFISTDEFSLNQDLDSGTVVRPSIFGQTDFSNDSTGEAELKMVVNASADTEPADDTATLTIYIADFDWNMHVNKIIGPDTGDVDTTGGVEYTFVVENVGNQATPEEVIVSYAVTVGGESFFAPVTHDNSIAPGDTAHLTYDFDFSGNFDNINQMGNLETCILPLQDFTKDQNAAISCEQDFNYVGEDEGGGPGSIANNSEVSNIEVYPNPVEGEGLIQYSLEKSTMVDLSIYNMSGQSIKTLQEGNQTAGQHNVNFDVTDLNAGAYIYKLQTDEGVSTGRLMVK